MDTLSKIRLPLPCFRRIPAPKKAIHKFNHWLLLLLTVFALSACGSGGDSGGGGNGSSGGCNWNEVNWNEFNWC